MISLTLQKSMCTTKPRTKARTANTNLYTIRTHSIRNSTKLVQLRNLKCPQECLIRTREELSYTIIWMMRRLNWPDKWWRLVLLFLRTQGLTLEMNWRKHFTQRTSSKKRWTTRKQPLMTKTFLGRGQATSELRLAMNGTLRYSKLETPWLARYRHWVVLVLTLESSVEVCRLSHQLVMITGSSCTL